MINELAIEDLRPGMILASSIKNKFGQVMIGEGLELTEKHIFLLKTWDIHSAKIKAEDDDSSIKTEEELLEFNQKKEDYINSLDWKPRNKNEEDLIELGFLAFINNYK